MYAQVSFALEPPAKLILSIRYRLELGSAFIHEVLQPSVGLFLLDFHNLLTKLYVIRCEDCSVLYVFVAAAGSVIAIIGEGLCEGVYAQEEKTEHSH